MARLFFSFLLLAPVLFGTAIADPLWPEPKAENRPWTRWWWLGSAVDDAEITRELEEFRRVGIGGVEITAIYGVRGQEERQLDYLSEAWLARLRHTCNEAQRLGLGVDLSLGSGWRCGGPRVPVEESACFFGVSGEDANPALAIRQGRERVKRPGPGGAGLTIDVYDCGAVEHYLMDLNQRLAAALPKGAIRAQFHDSFEYGSDWSRQLPQDFCVLRGYRLEPYLPALVRAWRKEELSDEDRRVVYDYRRTLEDLYRTHFLETWGWKAHLHGEVIRNQGHGSPGNLLDLYAAADIPETEVFGDHFDPLVHQLASSAGHVMGRRLISSETFTWLSEHFQSDLGKFKRYADDLYLCGINHLFFHGTAYSPPDAAWPGWLFYASSQLNDRNPLWRELPTLTAYFTRCQSYLQAGKPDRDVLLYWPIDDTWMTARGLRKSFGIDGDRWEADPGFHAVGQALWEAGLLFDFVSDAQLAKAGTHHQEITLPGGSYRAVVIPPLHYLRPETATRLARLASDGVPILSQATLAEADAPGLDKLEERRAVLREQVAKLREQPSFLVGDDPVASLVQAGVTPDGLHTVPGLRWVRRRLPDWRICYFVVNQGKAPVAEWVTPSRTGAVVVLLDPWDGRGGLARRRADSAFWLALAPNESRLVLVGETRQDVPLWVDLVPTGQRLECPGPWRVSFVAGGPVRPPARTVETLSAYTSWPEAECQRFAGTVRYECTISLTPDQAGRQWLLDLGDIDGAARVFVNGTDLGLRVSVPYRCPVPATCLGPGSNRLAVEVTGTAANRIRDLDRRGIVWRIFRDINFVNRQYKPFDASGWATAPAGLRGDVALVEAEPGR